MTEEQLPISAGALVAIFVLAFPLFWCAIFALIAMAGWRQIAAVYPANSDPPLSADRVRWGSMAVMGKPAPANYGACINGWFSQAGFWLRPSPIFSAFHPMIHVPWARVEAVEEERKLWSHRVRVKLAGGVPDLMLTGKLGRAVLERAAPRPARAHA